MYVCSYSIKGIVPWFKELIIEHVHLLSMSGIGHAYVKFRKPHDVDDMKSSGSRGIVAVTSM